MKATELEAIVKSGGRPTVALTGALWDESFGEAGMIAVVTGMRRESHDTYDTILFVFDYSGAREHNLSLQGRDWYLPSGDGGTGTAIEAGIISVDDLTEEVSFESEGDVPVALRDGDGPMAAYLTHIGGLAGEKPTYVEWLEQEWERQKQSGGGSREV